MFELIAVYFFHFLSPPVFSQEEIHEHSESHEHTPISTTTTTIATTISTTSINPIVQEQQGCGWICKFNHGEGGAPRLILPKPLKGVD